MINRLRPVSSLGCPYHGEAVDEYYLGRKVCTIPSGAATGPCVLIRHPAAPGAKEYQDSGDYRNYALAVGHTRSINGADGGVGIGRNRWLYCDPNGATWLLRLNYGFTSVTETTMYFEVVLDKVFGRFGREYPSIETTMTGALGTAYVEWQPEIPSWYDDSLFGGYTPSIADLCASVDLDWINTLAFSEDGSEVYVNISMNDLHRAVSWVYPETSNLGRFWGMTYGRTLASVLKITIGGTSLPEENGVGLTAQITLFHDFAELVSSRTYTPGNPARLQYSSILYCTPYGDVTRDFDVTFGDTTPALDFGDVTISAFGETVNVAGDGVATGLCSLHEIGIAAQNCIWVGTYKDGGVGDNILNEYYLGTDIDNLGLELWHTLRTAIWEPSDAFEPELPSDLYLGVTHDPGSPANIHVWLADRFIPYTGTTYCWF